MRLDDPAFGQEAQIDFGHVGSLPVDGKQRKLWALVVTLSASRYTYVWPLHGFDANASGHRSRGRRAQSRRRRMYMRTAAWLR